MKKTLKIILLAILIIVLVLVVITFMNKIYLFSEVNGVVLKNGKPVVNATIEREFKWIWKNEVGKDETTTNANGEFHFPGIYRLSFLAPISSHEPLIKQTIIIIYNNRTYEAFMHDKRNYDKNGETNNKLDLNCNLESETIDTGLTYGICTFYISYKY